MKKMWFNIFSTQAESYNSSKQERNVYAELSKMKGIKFRPDNYGNILVTRGEADFYPLITSHMDTVDMIQDDYVIHEEEGKVFASNGRGIQLGLGGDDKNGIIAMLEFLWRTSMPIKMVFFKDEECGFVGSSNTDSRFFTDVSYVAAVDRKGNSDILLGYGNAYAGDLVEYIPEVLGYKHVSKDTMCDSSNLTDAYGIASINISCGYYNPHSCRDYTILDELENTINYLERLIDSIPTREQYKVDIQSYDAQGYGFSYRSYGSEGFPEVTESEARDISYNETELQYIYEVLDDIGYQMGINLAEKYNTNQSFNELYIGVSKEFGFEIANNMINDIKSYGVDVKF